MGRLFFAMGFAWVYAALHACTGIKLTAKDESVIHGRTFDFAKELNPALVVVPRGLNCTAMTRQGEGLCYVTKYAAVGLIALNQPAILDGINEKGLAAAAFMFNGYAQYRPLDEQNQSFALSPIELPQWILTQCSTLEEVRHALGKIVLVSTLIKEWGKEPPAFHYIVYDRRGKSLVIEPIEGKLVVYENTLGVLTNGPPFSWHMAELRQHAFSSVTHIKPFKLNGHSLLPPKTQFSTLPGDSSSSARFIRAAFSTSGIHGNNREETVNTAFHILNQFDLLPQNHKEYSQLSCVRDPEALKFYFRTYTDSSIRVVDLNQFDLDDPEMKHLSIAETNLPQTAVDISAELN